MPDTEMSVRLPPDFLLSRFILTLFFIRYCGRILGWIRDSRTLRHEKPAREHWHIPISRIGRIPGLHAPAAEDRERSADSRLDEEDTDR